MVKKKKLKKIILFGTFDLFHAGHKNFLKQARRYGDYIILVVARDRTTHKLKGRRPSQNEKQRQSIIRQSGLAEKVILGNLTDKYGAIKKYRPDIVCLGYDQVYFIDELRQALDRFGLQKTKIIRLKPYKSNIYKTTKLLSAALARNSSP